MKKGGGWRDSIGLVLPNDDDNSIVNMAKYEVDHSFWVCINISDGGIRGRVYNQRGYPV